MGSKKIEFTSDQYLLALKLVYLGRWMLNSHSDTPDKTIDEIEQYFFQQAKSFSFDDLVEFDPQYKKYFPSEEFEEELETQISEYDDFTFWDELAWRMAERDFALHYDQAQILCMTSDEIFREKNNLADKYFEEFKTNGIEHLVLTD
jgi:hypothetical protein